MLYKQHCTEIKKYFNDSLKFRIEMLPLFLKAYGKQTNKQIYCLINRLYAKG